MSECGSEREGGAEGVRVSEGGIDGGIDGGRKVSPYIV